MGMLCLSWLPSRYNLCGLFIPLIIDGMVPLKFLSLTSKFKFLKEAIPFRFSQVPLRPKDHHVLQ